MYPKLKSVREPIYQRGYGKLNQARTALTDNSIIPHWDRGNWNRSKLFYKSPIFTLSTLLTQYISSSAVSINSHLVHIVEA